MTELFLIYFIIVSTIQACIYYLIIPLGVGIVLYYLLSTFSALKDINDELNSWGMYVLSALIGLVLVYPYTLNTSYLIHKFWLYILIPYKKTRLDITDYELKLFFVDNAGWFLLCLFILITPYIIIIFIINVYKNFWCNKYEQKSELDIKSKDAYEFSCDMINMVKRSIIFSLTILTFWIVVKVYNPNYLPIERIHSIYSHDEEN